MTHSHRCKGIRFALALMYIDCVDAKVDPEHLATIRSMMKEAKSIQNIFVRVPLKLNVRRSA